MNDDDELYYLTDYEVWQREDDYDRECIWWDED